MQTELANLAGMVPGRVPIHRGSRPGPRDRRFFHDPSESPRHVPVARFPSSRTRRALQRRTNGETAARGGYSRITEVTVSGNRVRAGASGTRKRSVTRPTDPLTRLARSFFLLLSLPASLRPRRSNAPWDEKRARKASRHIGTLRLAVQTAGRVMALHYGNDATSFVGSTSKPTVSPSLIQLWFIVPFLLAEDEPSVESTEQDPSISIDRLYPKFCII